MAEFRQVRRNESESLQSYMDRVRLATTRAFPDYNETAFERELAMAFLKGLNNPEFCSKYLQKADARLMTAMQLLNKAAEIEGVQKVSQPQQIPKKEVPSVTETKPVVEPIKQAVEPSNTVFAFSPSK